MDPSPSPTVDTVEDCLLKYGLTDNPNNFPTKTSAARLRKADVEDTIYRDDADTVYAWGNFFLPSPVHMQVFAVVEGVSWLGEQPILMTCKDGQGVFAYDGECLHLVAKDLQELFDEGLRCPAYEKYYEGDAFKFMTGEDWAQEMQSSLGKRLEEEHCDLVKKFESRILEILQNQQIPSRRLCTDL